MHRQALSMDKAALFEKSTMGFFASKSSKVCAEPWLRARHPLDLGLTDGYYRAQYSLPFV